MLVLEPITPSRGSLTGIGQIGRKSFPPFPVFKFHACVSHCQELIGSRFVVFHLEKGRLRAEIKKRVNK